MTCLGVKHKTQDLCPQPCGQSGRVTFDPFFFQRLVLSPSLSAAQRFTRRRLSSSRPSRHVMERFEHRSNPVYNIPNTSCLTDFLLEILNQRIRNKKKKKSLYFILWEMKVAFWDTFSYIFIQMMYSMSQGSSAQSVSLGLPIITSLKRLKKTRRFRNEMKWMLALPL